jgi:Lon protease-like protein
LPEVVYFPTSQVPLNIFEPRYLLMVNDALKKNIPIALCMREEFDHGVPEGPVLPLSGQRRVVAGCGHIQVLRENGDGTLLIGLRGAGKVELVSVTQTGPYIACEARLVAENNSVRPDRADRLAQFRQVLDVWAESHIESRRQRDAFLSDLVTPQQVVETATMLLVKDAATRQAVLDIDDINQRIDLVSAALATSMVAALPGDDSDVPPHAGGDRGWVN